MKTFDALTNVFISYILLMNENALRLLSIPKRIDILQYYMLTDDDAIPWEQLFEEKYINSIAKSELYKHYYEFSFLIKRLLIFLVFFSSAC